MTYHMGENSGSLLRLENVWHLNIEENIFIKEMLSKIKLNVITLNVTPKHLGRCLTLSTFIIFNGLFHSLRFIELNRSVGVKGLILIYCNDLTKMKVKLKMKRLQYLILIREGRLSEHQFTLLIPTALSVHTESGIAMPVDLSSSSTPLLYK